MYKLIIFKIVVIILFYIWTISVNVQYENVLSNAKYTSIYFFDLFFYTFIFY